ncbi:hypothetical protein BDU57DRAFT_451230 [Ampelomyces quisqualis]|uniref:Uncharacterized protein n=1 Tax=Ampelomyces quisqualis TaxID=50730 RepID=A0A6A5QJD6_AMPQU|nr:hypothetical protein BDU57DRAFT_451230 [Ampelomyces quisqualis]
MIETYNQIFGSFYSISLTIPTATLPITLSTSETLVKIANSLACIPLISTQISTALHHHRQTLYTSISHDPARFLLLSISLQNEAIYTESLIHIIGAHPSWPWPTARAVLPPSILAIVTRKSAQLSILCTEISRELLLTTFTVHNDRPVDAQNHSEFDTWFVVQIFRDTLARSFNALDDNRRPSLRRGSLFRKIGRGGSAWLRIEEASKLMRKIMPSALGSLEEDLEALKDYASGVVEKVARNRSLVDVEKEEVGWLTCVEIGKGDVLWRM